MANASESIEKVVYEVSEIEHLLGLKRSAVYNFIRLAYQKQEPFRVLKINGSYRIPKCSFDEWIAGKQ
ncbi:MAG: helix-turn-helix domain-containing protein [Clostridiales bacterium]|nr:helix-turn-helix domain-containing protein [Clostridiales bacterium]